MISQATKVLNNILAIDKLKLNFRFYIYYLLIRTKLDSIRWTNTHRNIWRWPVSFPFMAAITLFSFRETTGNLTYIKIFLAAHWLTQRYRSHVHSANQLERMHPLYSWFVHVFWIPEMIGLGGGGGVNTIVAEVSKLC